MKTTTRAGAEPIGIVIAGPPRTEVVPRVSAYVWGPAPELGAEAADMPEPLAEPRAA